jgi:hypothetical protein
MKAPFPEVKDRWLRIAICNKSYPSIAFDTGLVMEVKWIPTGFYKYRTDGF